MVFNRLMFVEMALYNLDNIHLHKHINGINCPGCGGTLTKSDEGGTKPSLLQKLFYVGRRQKRNHYRCTDCNNNYKLIGIS
ncbi:MAG: hypothetical protein V4543_07835 [Bacteroidota bacterium]